MASLIDSDGVGRAQYFARRYYDVFLARWSSLHPLMVAGRHRCGWRMAGLGARPSATLTVSAVCSVSSPRIPGCCRGCSWPWRWKNLPTCIRRWGPACAMCRPSRCSAIGESASPCSPTLSCKWFGPCARGRRLRTSKLTCLPRQPLGRAFYQRRVGRCGERAQSISGALERAPAAGPAPAGAHCRGRPRSARPQCRWRPGRQRPRGLRSVRPACTNARPAQPAPNFVGTLGGFAFCARARAPATRSRRWRTQRCGRRTGRWPSEPSS